MRVLFKCFKEFLKWNNVSLIPESKTGAGIRAVFPAWLRGPHVLPWHMIGTEPAQRQVSPAMCRMTEVAGIESEIFSICGQQRLYREINPSLIHFSQCLLTLRTLLNLFEVSYPQNGNMAYYLKLWKLSTSSLLILTQIDTYKIVVVMVITLFELPTNSWVKMIVSLAVMKKLGVLEAEWIG